MTGAVLKKLKLDNVLPTFAGKSPFVRAFIEGLFAGGVLMVLLMVWMHVRQDHTAQMLQPLIPSQTAMLEVPEVEQALEDNTPDIKLEKTKDIVALPDAPIEGLFEDKDGKSLPIIRASDNLTPFDAYKKSLAVTADKSSVAIVIVDFGLSETLSQSILNDLPETVTPVLSPYAQDPIKWAASARSFGREFWLSLPMQKNDFGYADTGPMTILKNAMEQENLKRLSDVMAVAAGYVGLVTEHNHDVFTGSAAQGVAKQIFSRGLGVVESTPDIVPFGLKEASETKHPHAQADIWIDTDLRPIALEGILKSAEQKAQRDGEVVLFTRPYPAVISALKEWAKTLESKNIQIVPLSHIAEKE